MSQLLFFVAGLIVGLGAAYYTGALKGGMDGPKNAGFPADSGDVHGGGTVVDGKPSGELSGESLPHDPFVVAAVADPTPVGKVAPVADASSTDVSASTEDANSAKNADGGDDDSGARPER